MPSVSTTDCGPVGPSMTVPGFERDTSGWGYDATRPSAPCTGSEMAILGQAACVPVDDCSAAFPPSGAFVVVTPSSPTTTGNVLGDAIASAPKGALIAVDSGVYEAVVINADVRIVGRCSEKVVLQGPLTTDPSVVGIAVGGGANVTMESVSVVGFGIGMFGQYCGALNLQNVVFSENYGGIAVADAGASLVLNHSVIEGPSLDRGITLAIGVAAFLGANVTLTNDDVRRENWALDSNDTGTEFLVQKSLIAFEQVPPYPAGFDAFTGAHARMEQSVMTTSTGRILSVAQSTPSTPPAEQSDPPGTMEIVESELIQSGTSRNDDSAIDINQGASLTLENTTLRHQSFAGVGVGDDGSWLLVEKSVIVAEPTLGPGRSAVIATGGTTVDLENSAVVAAQQIGIAADGTGGGVHLTVNQSLITGTLQTSSANVEEEGGSGQAICVANGAELHLYDSALVGNQGTGVLGTAESPLVVTGTLIDETTSQAKTTALGIGILLASGSGMEMGTSMVRRSAGTGVAFDGAGGTLSDSWLFANDVGVGTTGGTVVVQASAAPASVVQGKAVLFGTAFQGNTTSFSKAAIASP
jgi:hypothetical protein